MDDGIELNFSTPGSGTVRRPVAPKGGRWTDRAKTRKDNRQTVKKLTRVGSTNAAITTVPSTALDLVSVRPAQLDSRITPVPSQVAASSVKPAEPPRQQRTIPKIQPITTTHSLAIPSQPVAGPSRLPPPKATNINGKPTQIISSLFSSNPKTTGPKSKQPAQTLGPPSNAPITGDTSTFSGLGLDPLLTTHLQDKMSVKQPTGIQRSALPFMLSSPLDISTPTQPDPGDDYETSTLPPVSPTPPTRDIFIQSQTGSGKTLTYLLPIIQTLLPLSKLSHIDRSIGTLAIILAPTRELAGQITKVLTQILSLSLTSSSENMTRWLVPGLLTGGSTRTHEKARLRKGVPILVSTPGRLLDHLQNTSSFQCGKTMFLVLDEADRLMDLGFEETVRGIIKALDGRRRLEINSEKGEGEDDRAGMMKWPFWDRGRRTILCSATVDAKVQKLSGEALHDPITFRGTDEEKAESKGKSKVQEDVERALEEAGRVELPKIVDEDKFTPPSQLAQKYVVVPTKLRLVALVSLLRTLVCKGDGVKVIVFMSSTDSVDYHWKLLGGVQMSRSDLIKAEEEAAKDDAPESADEDGETKAPRKAKPRKSKSLEEPITLTSPLFPSTTLHRLHGSLPLPTRQKSLASFSSSSPSPSILICTSVASRGLDLPLVRAVVQYDLPTESGATEYVHRVGRTARAGKGGEAWAVVGTSEEGWVGWVEGKMDKSGSVKLRREGVEDVLKKGFGGKGWEYEARATEVQLGFERWVLQDDKNAALARKAFASYIRAYSTHPIEEKQFFHTKSLHLGHLAKSFALREAPGQLAPASVKAKSADTKSAVKRKRGNEDDDDEDDDEEAGMGRGKKVGKEGTARNETERRMYEAVRKAGRAFKSGGTLGEYSGVKGRSGNGGGSGGGGAGSEFQVMGTDDLEKMVGGKGR